MKIMEGLYMKKPLATLALVVALGVGAVAPAQAATTVSAPRPAVTAVTQGVAQTSSPGLGGIVSPSAPGPVNSSPVATPQPRAFIVNRIAIRAALLVIKKTNKKLYGQIKGALAKGKEFFVKHWNAKIRPHVPGVLQGVTGGFIYDMITRIVGF